VKEEEIVEYLDRADALLEEVAELLPRAEPASDRVRRVRYLVEGRRILRVIRVDLCQQVLRGQKE
jgi:hypothetical protein